MNDHHPIKVVARRTGLSAHVIRVWEKRYGAVDPARTGTNRRLYSEEQIHRLNLLRVITRGGHSIGLVANLPTEKLEILAAPVAQGETAAQTPAPAAAPSSPYVGECLAAVKNLDAEALEATLREAGTVLGAQGLLQRVIGPLTQRIGEIWREGGITAAHEHFASVVIRVFLGCVAKPFAGSESAPVIVVATPSGQLHELGALLVAASAANLGWRVTYLGASLPAAEIAGVARQQAARCVALSIVYPDDDPRLGEELSRLRSLLPPETAMLAGGRAMPSYRDVLEKTGATQVGDLAEFCKTLDELRRPRAKGGARALAGRVPRPRLPDGGDRPSYQTPMPD